MYQIILCPLHPHAKDAGHRTNHTAQLKMNVQASRSLIDQREPCRTFVTQPPPLCTLARSLERAKTGSRTLAEVAPNVMVRQPDDLKGQMKRHLNESRTSERVLDYAQISVRRRGVARHRVETRIKRHVIIRGVEAWMVNR